MPRIMTEKSGEPPSKKVIDSWLTSAKTIMASEDLDWIVNLTNAMRKNADTDEYFIKHPSVRKLLLEEEAIDTGDKGEILKIIQHLVAHKAPAREYQSLRKGEKYTEDLAVQDFKDIKREMTSFNAQMMKVLEDKDGQEGYMVDIQVRIHRNYGTDPNIFAGILAWRMIEDLDSMSIEELTTIESSKLHNLITHGPDSIRKSVDMFNWIVSIDKSVAQLTQLCEDNKHIRMLAILPVMSVIERKFTEQKWETFRAEVWKYREKDADNEKYKWHSFSTSLKNIHIRNSGEDNLPNVLMPDDMQSTGYRRLKGSRHAKSVKMPPGVSLAATSYQDFQNIASDKAPSKYTGPGAIDSKSRGDAHGGDKDLLFGRPAMTEHKWKCGIPGCNWVKCNAPKPDQNKRNERAHVAEDDDEDNVEYHDEVLEEEHETAHWADDNNLGAIGRGTGNDFGLTTAHATLSGAGVTSTTVA